MLYSPLLGFLAVFLRFTATQQGPEDRLVHLYQSHLSHATFPFRAVAADSSGFDRLWKEVVSDPRKPRPDVDFHKYMVVVAALGEVPSTSYRINIRAVDYPPGAIRVHVDLSSLSPESTCPTEPMFTSPVDVVRVPRTGGLVAFVERVVLIGCR